MNSVLQCLVHTKSLHTYFGKKRHSMSKLCTKQSPQDFCIACRLEELVDASFQLGAPAFHPRALANGLPVVAKGFRLGRQEDAHEFMRHVLEALTKIFAPLKGGAQWGSGRFTAVQQFFQGALQSQIRCLACQKDSVTFDPFLDLSLELAGSDRVICPSVASAMEMFMTAEFLEGDNRYQCEHCQKLVRARKQFSLASPPRYLTVHLKRFEALRSTRRARARDVSEPAPRRAAPSGALVRSAPPARPAPWRARSSFGSGKIGQHVKFDDELDLSRFAAATKGQPGASLAGFHYKLCAPPARRRARARRAAGLAERAVLGWQVRCARARGRLDQLGPLLLLRAAARLGLAHPQRRARAAGERAAGAR
jgi:ubiquitin carboxyl-terminal hydrolase 36/42